MIIKLIKNLFAVVLVFLTSCPLGVAEEKANVIMKSPVKVSAKHLQGDMPNRYPLELLIEHGSSRFSFRTEIRSDSLAEALKIQEDHVRWKGPYLLVGWERGGGNAARSFLDIVFMLTKQHLIYLGEVDTDSVENGFFKDWYNKFELNKLTSHAESPFIRLVIEERGGRLVVNLEKTWSENQKRFKDNKTVIKYLQTKEKIKSESRVLQLVGPLLFNAVLGTYCKHEKDTVIFLEIAKRELDQDRLKIFNDILARVIAGELPKAEVEVKKYSKTVEPVNQPDTE
jgi:hypothetical protein